MPNNYTNVFGGTTIYPSDVSYLILSLTESVELQWPLEANPGPDIVARIIDVTPSANGYSITMPDATKTGAGQTVLFNNLSGGSYSFYVKNNTGSTIATVAPGEQWQIYLASTATAAGTWRVFRYGASTATVQPSALVGYGLTVTGSQLSTATVVSTFSSSPLSILTTDRAAAFVWTGSGAATVNLPSTVSAGNNFFVSVRNEGGGNVTIDPAGSETVNNVSTIALAPGDSITLITDGLEWFTLGFGQKAVFAFDYTSIDLTGESSPYTLSGSELNRISYDFIGALTENMEIIVPATTQQYWVTNDTTESYTLGLKTASQATAIDVPQGYSAILYCDGNNVVAAAGSTASTPSVVNPGNGGTGITSYTVGDLIYASGSTTLSKLADVATGNALISGGTTTAPLWGKIGLTTHVSGTLPVANGGTGVTASTGTTTLVLGTTPTITALREVKAAISASAIDLATANYFSKTISGTTTFTVSNVPTTGTASSFILDLTNGGSATVNWWSGVKWAGGTAPTLTSSGRDVLGFFTYDGGTTWSGFVLGKDVK